MIDFSAHALVFFFFLRLLRPRAACMQPLFVRQDIATHFQFRIRNLPYDYDNYIVEIDEPTQEIVLKTKNKKCGTQAATQPSSLQCAVQCRRDHPAVCAAPDASKLGSDP